ncbi:MAG: class I SAM-dependent methyltransferase [Thermoleophilia bacterium]|nr:class I SAM-dependent methyltransferase [Thermoleophilia bacterium]
MRREDWNRRYAAKELLWSAGPSRFLVAEVEGLAPGRALDLACGEGRNAVWLASRGWRVTAVDFAEVAIARAARRAEREGLEVDLVCADLLEYEPEERAFDLVLVFYLQLPAAERRLVLQRAAGAVAPGGTFLLVGHERANLEQGTGGPSDPRVLYAPEEIAAELPGLEIERAERVFREVEGAERPAIDALVRARRPAAQESARSRSGGKRASSQPTSIRGRR